jgi:hypothetical protein
MRPEVRLRATSPEDALASHPPPIAFDGCGEVVSLLRWRLLDYRPEIRGRPIAPVPWFSCAETIADGFLGGRDPSIRTTQGNAG